MLAGLVIGPIAAGVAWAFFEPSLSRMAFGGAFTGLVTGLCFPEAAMNIVEGTLHFLAGAITAAAAADGDLVDVEPVPDTPRWITAAFFFGVVFAVVVWALRWL